MASIMVPKSLAEAPTQGGDSVFPAGSWLGEIENVEVRALPYVPGAGQGYASPEDIEITSLWLGSNVSADGEGECGARKFFHDFVTRDGAVSIDAGPEIGETSWQMQKSAALLANLAAALGATEDVEFEGETYTQTSEDFLDQLQAGTLNGSRVGFVSWIREWTSKDKTKSGKSAELSEFFQAV